MIGLLGIGVALLLGIGMRIAAVTGAIMVVLMWSASLPPQDDIFMANHIVYASGPSLRVAQLSWAASSP
jgi:thiosulfate dehydrogenase (quinone) large subunit